MSADKTLVNRESITYSEARERVLSAVQPLAVEKVALDELRGRALRAALTAPHPLPPFSNSAMDGYAVRSEDVLTASDMSPAELKVVETVAAGRVASAPLGRGEAIRIMTGAQIPEGADAVIQFEKVETITSGIDEKVWIDAPVKVGTNIRPEATDIEEGAEVFAEGREISPHDIALLASLGFAEVEAGPKPRVTVISTGDELLRVDQPLRPGAIRDSNLPMLRELLIEAQCEVVEAVRASDDPDDVARSIHDALETSDVVLTLGGVSAGDFDPVKASIAGLDGAQLWRVAMRPGQPQAFGVSKDKLFFGLPGNPASVACVFEALVRPALRKLQGFAHIDRPRLMVRAGETITSKEGRTDFVRVSLQWRTDGWRARSAGAQVSGHLTPQAHAHALLIVPDHIDELGENDLAEAMMIRWPELTMLAENVERAARGVLPGGPQWSAMNAQTRHAGSKLVPQTVPDTPGVYVWYRRGEPVYVGGASNLRMRIWRDHLSQDESLARSELRRRTAEHLGCATAQEIHMGLYTPTEGDVQSVLRWLRSCEVTWIGLANEEEVDDLEKALVGEWTPMFNKR